MEISLIKRVRIAAKVDGGPLLVFQGRRSPIIRRAVLSAKGRAEKLGNRIELDVIGRSDVASLLLSNEYSAKPARFYHFI